MGNLIKSKEFYDKSIHMFVKFYDENHPQTFMYLNNLGTLYVDMGNLPKAKDLMNKSLNIARNL